MSFFSYPQNLLEDAEKTLEFSSLQAFVESLSMFKIFRKVRKHTKVRIPRLKILWKLCKAIDADCVPGDIAEFGVWRGGASAVLAYASENSPYKRRVWLFDSFEGNPQPTKEDTNLLDPAYQWGQATAEEKIATGLFSSLAIPSDRYRIVKGWFHETLPRLIPLKLALMHFDADMYESTKCCLEKFYDALSPGGYMVFNSWGVRDGVRKAMREFMQQRDIDLPLFPTDNGVGCYFQKVATSGAKPARYRGLQHDTKRRFISYWHQVYEALALEPKTMLEVGIGNGFVSRYLKGEGINITTCDINKDLNPDYVSSVTQLPFQNNSFHLVMACEILEHMPYQETLKALGELARVSSQWVLISLPDATRTFRIELPIPKIGKWKKLITLPKRNPPAHVVTDKEGHHWEIGKKDYPLNRITRDMEKAGLAVKKTYRIFEFPYHRFFVLEKTSSFELDKRKTTIL